MSPTLHTLHLTKPDGRALRLYGHAPLDPGLQAPSPFADKLAANPHLRWHPLRGEWTAYAAHRQDRTFLPPPEYNPLAPTTDPTAPTEVPAGTWDVAVFDNRFPALCATAHDPPAVPVATAAARGQCEVVVFTQDAHGSLATLPLWHLDLLLQVWGERTSDLGRRGDIAFVLPFENRGTEVGVTLHHPHGQIYAYPEIPPVPARMLHMQAEHLRHHGTGLLASMIDREEQDGARMLYGGPHAVAFVPACARYPYEVWVAPRRPVARFDLLGPPQRADLARALKTVLMKYEGLWQRPFPYLMAWYQAPTDGGAHPESHLHAQFYPPYRSPGRLKYLAGTELAAGWFAMDALPEDKARELQAVAVDPGTGDLP